MQEETRQVAGWEPPMGRVLDTTVARSMDPAIRAKATDGGVVTALALPTVAFWGPGAALALTATVLLGWLLIQSPLALGPDPLRAATWKKTLWLRSCASPSRASRPR